MTVKSEIGFVVEREDVGEVSNTNKTASPERIHRSHSKDR